MNAFHLCYEVVVQEYIARSTEQCILGSVLNFSLQVSMGHFFGNANIFKSRCKIQKRDRDFVAGVVARNRGSACNFVASTRQTVFDLHFKKIMNKCNKSFELISCCFLS